MDRPITKQEYDLARSAVRNAVRYTQPGETGGYTRICPADDGPVWDVFIDWATNPPNVRIYGPMTSKMERELGAYLYERIRAKAKWWRENEGPINRPALVDKTE
jgi:hypothetical protein